MIDSGSVGHADRVHADRVQVSDQRLDQDVLVSGEQCARLLAGVFDAEDLPARAMASITFVDADVIAELARTHLGHTGPTDVLSFPIDGRGPVVRDEPWVVGDLVLCPEVAAAQAADHAGDLDSEVALLVVHGGLHLCGWDHASPEQQSAMWARERRVLDSLGVHLSADPWTGPQPSGSGDREDRR